MSNQEGCRPSSDYDIQKSVIERIFDERKQYLTSVLEQAQDEIPFEDSGTISPWAEEAVRTLHALGVTHGENGNVFSPRDVVSFEQMLVLSYRCLTLFRT